MKMECKRWGKALLMCGALAMGMTMGACSSDDDTPGDQPEEGKDPEVTYQGTTAYSNGILFNNGTEPGNGDQNFHFTGDVTLERGTYLLKGWVYVDAGAKLNIPAGTIIKGDKQTRAALIIEPGGYCEMKGTKEAPIVMTSEEAPGQRRPYSETFFRSEPSNQVATEAELNLTDPMNTGQNYCPATALSDGNGGYIGAFRDGSDNWLEGWTNFDPQNTVY